jgi:cytochrome c556
MYVHYQQVGEIHTAVILGDAGATRRPARALANARHTYGADADLAWDLMRAEARVIQGQSEIDDIARSVARLGMACGACHLAMDQGPRIRPTEAPASSRNPVGHMTRHQWAVDRLWEGLVGPSLPAWAAGAGALGDEALDLGPGSRPEEAERLAARVHELGEEARHATDWEHRAEIYGGLLQTCAQCHEYFGMRMR